MGERDDTRDRYLVALRLDGDEDEARKKRSRALEIAHDHRKFEIDLLWRRSTYLWGFQIVAFAGVAALGGSLFQEAQGSSPQNNIAFSLLMTTLIICFGLGTCFMWFLTARASRIWFHNWEKHIDFLEDEFTGSIYKTLFFRKNQRIHSLTGINEAATVFTSLIWTVLLFAISYCAIAYGTKFTIFLVLGSSTFILGAGGLAFAKLAQSRAKAVMTPLSQNIELNDGAFFQRGLDQKG